MTRRSGKGSPLSEIRKQNLQDRNLQHLPQQAGSPSREQKPSAQGRQETVRQLKGVAEKS